MFVSVTDMKILIHDGQGEENYEHLELCGQLRAQHLNEKTVSTSLLLGKRYCTKGNKYVRAGLCGLENSTQLSTLF
jgi:hypothetical protein